MLKYGTSNHTVLTRKTGHEIMKIKILPTPLKSKFFRIFIPLSIAISTGNLYAQNAAENALSIMNQKIPQEKVYLLLSQDQFAAGETAYFNAYVYQGYESSAISTTLFVELLDQNKKSVSKTLIPLYDGQGFGSLTIPEKLQEDVYYIRSYTTWMLNFPEKFQFLKPVEVFNPSSEKKLVKDEKTKWTATLHPESGVLLNGVESKIAVRLHSEGTPPSEWSGFVTSNTDPSKPIANFKNLDGNVALFNLIPETGKTYSVTVKDNLGQESIIPLQQSKDSGINLKVENLPESIKYTIRSKSESDEAQKFKMIGTVNSVLVYKANITKRKGVDASSEIPMKDFPNGVLQLTIFDQSENVVAKRLVFMKPNHIEVQKPNITVTSKNLAPRGENEFDVNYTEGFSDYAIVVNPIDKDDNPDRNNFISNLYLAGDLSSKIFDPSQYFQKNTNTAALDALLISENWERFDWESLVNGKFPTLKYTPENYISYTGLVTTNGRPAVNKLVSLVFDSPDAGNSVSQQVTDSNGKFVIDNMNFTDNTKVSYLLETGKNDYTQVFFQPNNQFVAYTSSLPKIGYHLETRNKNEPVPTKVSQYVASRDLNKKVNEKVYNIEEVKIKGRLQDKTKKLDEELSSGLFRGNSDKIFDFVNEDQIVGGFTNIIQWLQGRVAGLQVKYESDGTGSTTYVPYLRNTKADIYVDEMKMDAGMLNTINPSTIAMVKVIRNFLGGANSSGTAIAVYTKRGDMGNSQDKEPNMNLNAGNNFSVLRGFQAETEFNNLDYASSSAQNINGDFRKLLYWNPMFSVPYGDMSNFRFYNNDEAKKYRITIISVNKDLDAPLFYEEVIQ